MLPRRDAAAARTGAACGLGLLPLALELLQPRQLLQRSRLLRPQALDRGGLRVLALGEERSACLEIGRHRPVPIDLVHRPHGDELRQRIRPHLDVEIAAEEERHVRAARVHVATDRRLVHDDSQTSELGLGGGVLGLDPGDLGVEISQLRVGLRELVRGRVGPALRRRHVVSGRGGKTEPGGGSHHGAGNKKEPRGSSPHDGPKG